MKTRNLLLAFGFVAMQFISCNSSFNGPMHDPGEEIMETEMDFAAAAKSKGIAEAFYLFADDSAVIKRANDTLIQGKENIKRYYQETANKKAEVSWLPDFVDVSADGTLGYTYGKYTWKVPGDSGTIQVFKGVFHTVWKRQNDGSWKYVWD